MLLQCTISLDHFRLKSANLWQVPEVLFNYMMTKCDRAKMRAAAGLRRKISEQLAFDKLRGDELTPGAQVRSSDEVNAFVRGRGESAYQPSCTCRVG